MSNGAVTPGLSGSTALVLTLQSDVNILVPKLWEKYSEILKHDLKFFFFAFSHRRIQNWEVSTLSYYEKKKRPLKSTRYSWWERLRYAGIVCVKDHGPSFAFDISDTVSQHMINSQAHHTVSAEPQRGHGGCCCLTRAQAQEFLYLFYITDMNV